MIYIEIFNKIRQCELHINNKNTEYKRQNVKLHISFDKFTLMNAAKYHEDILTLNSLALIKYIMTIKLLEAQSVGS